MPVRLITWNRYGLCGAASAQMVLHALDGGQMGITDQEQEDLWTSIKENTQPPDDAAGGRCSADIPEAFNNMVRDSCGGGVVHCWLTYPTALAAALRAALARLEKQTNLQVQLRAFPNQDNANNAIRQCIAAGGLSIVLINEASHWVVVYDWNESGRKPVRILDPAGFRAKYTVAGWNDYPMSIVDCPGSQFDRNYVLVEVR